MTDEPIRPVVDISYESTPEEEEEFRRLEARMRKTAVPDMDGYTPDYKSAHQDLTNRVLAGPGERSPVTFHDPHHTGGHHKTPGKTVRKS